MNNQQRTGVRPVNPAVREVRRTPPSPMPPNKKRKSSVVSPEILIKTAMLAIVAVIAGAFAVNTNISYTHNYITEARPSAMPSQSASELLVAVSEADAPIVSEGKPSFYDYTLPVQLSSTVDYGYFDDTVFIGDSRVKGLLLYTDISPIDFSVQMYRRYRQNPISD